MTEKRKILIQTDFIKKIALELNCDKSKGCNLIGLESGNVAVEGLPDLRTFRESVNCGGGVLSQEVLEARKQERF